MVNVAQNNAMPSARFSQSDLLKFIQDKGSKTLWRTVSGLDSVTKRGEWPGGKMQTYHLTTDAGGLAFSGLNQQAGGFAPSDRAAGIQGFCIPKYQTFTMYFDRVLNKLTEGEQRAYLSAMKMEIEQKTSFQKSFMNLQQLTDGTGRWATPVGLGASNTASGTTFTLNAPSVLMKIKLSSADTAVGSVAHLMEGSIVSFLFPSYDENADGTVATTRTDCVVRYLTLGFKSETGTNISFFDAFRVVRLSQGSNEILVAPARRAAADHSTTYAPYSSWDESQHVQAQGSSTMWCDGTGTVTVTSYLGRTSDLTAPSTVTALNLAAVFNPRSLTSATPTANPTAVFLVNPGFVPTGSNSYGYPNIDFSQYTQGNFTSSAAAAARALLGLGWDPAVDSLYDPAAIDVSLVNPYLMTGIESLVYNDTNMVHGIPRYSVQQILPTKKDNNAQALTYNSLFGLLVEHVNRNREKAGDIESAFKENLLTINPIGYSSLLSLSEQDRMITDDKGIRGTSAKVIQLGNKKFELDMNSTMRVDRISCLPKNSLYMYGGTMEPVNLDGQKQFMALNSNGKRCNAYEMYFTVSGEQKIENLRECAFMRNFTVTVL
jgi:hypothetical protein